MNFVGQASSDFPVTEIGIDAPTLRGREQEQRHDDVSQFIRQFSINQITDLNGRTWDVLSIPNGEDTSNSSQLWGLEVISDGGRYQGVKITNPGTIRYTAKIDDLVDEILEIESTLAPREDEWLYLEINTDLEITLKAGEWESYPEMWEFEELGSAGYQKMVKAFYPLWQFQVPDSDNTDQVAIKDGVAAEKFAGGHLQMENVLVEAATGQVSNVIQLIDSYKGKSGEDES